MKIELTARECEEIGHVHYLLSSGFYTGASDISIAEQRELLEKARIWFERAYIYWGSASAQRMAEHCEQKKRDIRPALFAVAS